MDDEESKNGSEPKKNALESTKRRRLSFGLSVFCNKTSNRAKLLATELRDILLVKDCLPHTLTKILKESLPEDAYSNLKFKNESPTLDCERCHSQQSVSEGERIMVTRTMIKGELTGNSMHCEKCDSQQNHQVGNLISDEDIATAQHITMLIQQISGAPSGEKGTSRKSAAGFRNGVHPSNASYESLGGSHDSSSSSLGL